MTKTKQDNDVTYRTGVVVENETELSRLIRLGVVCEKTRPIQSVTSLSNVILVIDHTQFDWSQLSFIFNLDRIYMIDHVIVLFNFHHKLLSVI